MQMRFGARTGAAPIFLGLTKLVLGLVFGSSLFQLLQAFPPPLLGALLIFAGNMVQQHRIKNCHRSHQWTLGLSLNVNLAQNLDFML